ncbi:Putative putative HTH-type transcriptional regulator in instable DNA locus [Mycobacterium sp. smrl_JER01]
MSTRDAASPATSLPPLSAPKSLTDEVVSVLRSHILSGHFQSGDQLVQAELARSLGVSRGPVREALNQLKAEGLVFDEPRRGTFVRRPAPKDVRDALDLRLALEVRAAHLVIERGDSTALQAIERALDALITAIGSGDLRAIGDRDLAFHDAICAASGNQVLYSVFTTQAKTVTVLLHVDELSYSFKPEELISEHRAIFDRIRTGDKIRVQELLTVHIEGVRDRLLAVM